MGALNLLRPVWNGGTCLDLGRHQIALDPRNSKIDADLITVSHAHFDHVHGFLNPSRKLATSETMKIFQTRTRKRVRNGEVVQYGKDISFGNLKISFHDAGHVLGSAQVKIDDGEETLVFTSDINVVESLTLSKAEILDSDILIIESTYGSPMYAFPPREDVYLQMAEWSAKSLCKQKMPVFCVYPLGKGQEVIKVMNEYTSIPVVVHPAIKDISDIYVEGGIKLNYKSFSDEEGKEILFGGECACIVPSLRAFPSLKGREISSAAVTGWGTRFKARDLNEAFVLSSHADFGQLLDYISESSPSEVYTVYGYTKQFAKHIKRKLGIDAMPITDSTNDYDYFFNRSTKQTKLSKFIK